jgi:hypothetical protein
MVLVLAAWTLPLLVALVAFLGTWQKAAAPLLPFSEPLTAPTTAGVKRVVLAMASGYKAAVQLYLRLRGLTPGQASSAQPPGTAWH